MTKTLEKRYTREEIIEIKTEQNGFKCYMCPKPFDEDRHAVTIDHVLPLAKGGTWAIENLELCGLSCNQEKADRLWLEDGTLEPRPVRDGYHERKVNKQGILDRFCDLCFDGRLLLPEESCPECSKVATAFPWSTKMTPSECPHEGVYWCWCCSIGIYTRRPAIVDVLDGSVLD